MSAKANSGTLCDNKTSYSFYILGERIDPVPCRANCPWWELDHAWFRAYGRALSCTDGALRELE